VKDLAQKAIEKRKKNEQKESIMTVLKKANLDMSAKNKLHE